MLYTHGKPTITLEEIRGTYRVPTKDDLLAHLGERATKGAGKIWAPIHHADLVDSIYQAADKRGFKVVEPQFNLSDDTHSIYGSMQLEGRVSLGGTMAPVLGFRSDNLQRFRLMGVTGARVFICNNGAIVGDFIFGFRHTNRAAEELEVSIDDGMSSWERQAAGMLRFTEWLQAQALEQETTDHLLMQAVRGRILAPSQLGKVDAVYTAYQEAAHPHHEAFGARNAWSLYNAVTETAKTFASPAVSERGLKGFPRLIADTLGYTELEALVEEPSLN